MRPLLVILFLLLLPLFGCANAASSDTTQATADGAVLISYAAMAPTLAPRPNPDVDPESDVGKPVERSVLLRPRLDATYPEALAGYKQHGRPLLVVVSADWCAPCQRLKAELPGHLQAGVFDGVELAVIDWDRDRAIAQRMAGVSAKLPTVLCYWVDDDGVQRVRMHRGSLSRDGFRQLIPDIRA